MRLPSPRRCARRLLRGLVPAHALGLSLALLLCWQSGAAQALLGTPEAQRCCCKARGQRCSCPVCAHAREVSAPLPQLNPCSARGAPALPAHLLHAALPVLPARPHPVPAGLLPPAPPPPRHEPPAAEVPTPPPLA